MSYLGLAAGEFKRDNATLERTEHPFDAVAF